MFFRSMMDGEEFANAPILSDRSGGPEIALPVRELSPPRTELIMENGLPDTGLRPSSLDIFPAERYGGARPPVDEGYGRASGMLERFAPPIVRPRPSWEREDVVPIADALPFPRATAPKLANARPPMDFAEFERQFRARTGNNTYADARAWYESGAALPPKGAPAADVAGLPSWAPLAAAIAGALLIFA